MVPGHVVDVVHFFTSFIIPLMGGAVDFSYTFHVVGGRWLIRRWQIVNGNINNFFVESTDLIFLNSYLNIWIYMGLYVCLFLCIFIYIGTLVVCIDLLVTSGHYGQCDTDSRGWIVSILSSLFKHRYKHISREIHLGMTRRKDAWNKFWHPICGFEN